MVEQSGRVLWHVGMSVDGFIAGPAGDMDWALTGITEPSAMATEIIDKTGAVLAGRGWYDVASSRFAGRDGIYGGAWSGPVFVLSHTVPPGPRDERITFLTCDLASAVTQARSAAAGRDVVLLGANLAGQATEAGFVDDIVIHLVPILLGDGVRLYGHPGASSIPLELLSVAASGQVTDLRFRVGAAA